MSTTEAQTVESLARQLLTSIRSQTDTIESDARALEEALDRSELDAKTERLTADFVWQGCRTCWYAKDANRPVVTYQQWLNNTYRHMAYRCTVCSDREQRLVTVFPSAWGFPMSAAFELLPGGPVPETLETWGQSE